MKTWLWRTLGLFFVGCGYIGAITPGIPTTVFLILALWCFSKSSPELHSWVYNHPMFGQYVRNWSEKRIYPLRAKLIMIFFCCVSLVWMFLSGVSTKGLVGTGLFMLFWIVWAWRYPTTEDEYRIRKMSNKKIGWLK